MAMEDLIVNMWGTAAADVLVLDVRVGSRVIRPALGDAALTEELCFLLERHPGGNHTHSSLVLGPFQLLNQLE